MFMLYGKGKVYTSVWRESEAAVSNGFWDCWNSRGYASFTGGSSAFAALASFCAHSSSGASRDLTWIVALPGLCIPTAIVRNLNKADIENVIFN